MAQFNITLTEEELHGLFMSNGRDTAIAKLMEKIFNEVLRGQSTEQLCAEPYERTDNGRHIAMAVMSVKLLVFRWPIANRKAAGASFLNH